ncbi:GATA transcription factor 7-like [Amaranthus tricolor]|uniref:GATA transcription factor 7-like n=1 Tax=Amaranthus tricolor TaxID=29722 RepID=UPI002586F7CF|nr:GATA transcription factor 7-like [Amaranthus tricolor]
MECMEIRALKSRFSSELAMNSTNPQSIIDDFGCVNGLSSEDFSIDDFFDLPNEDKIDGLEDEEEEKDSSNSISFQHHFDDSNSNYSTFPPDLFPVDDMQDLEIWSHLMDDSIQDPTLACPNPILDGHKRKTGYKSEPVYKPVFVEVPILTKPVPVKPRSKRLRSCNFSWSSILSEKNDLLSSPVSTLLFSSPVYNMGIIYGFEKSIKKPKKKQGLVSSAGENSPVQRRCSHCQVTKTPQWRAGPNGPKTLCNACGVRFKSGRLFPEYRPACSPSFSCEIHSNSHRKVLEMRKKKEGIEHETGSSLTVEPVLRS